MLLIVLMRGILAILPPPLGALILGPLEPAFGIRSAIIFSFLNPLGERLYVPLY